MLSTTATDTKLNTAYETLKLIFNFQHLVSYTVKPALNGNIFRAEKDVKYPGLNGNCLMRKQKSK
jgi:hypothetical protein